MLSIRIRNHRAPQRGSVGEILGDDRTQGEEGEDNREAEALHGGMAGEWLEVATTIPPQTRPKGTISARKLESA